MTKDTFRGKRCLVFWAFLKALDFASHERFFCLALSAVPYPFLIVITGFLMKKKKNQPSHWMIMNFPGQSPSAASLWYALDAGCLPQYITPLKSVGIVWRPTHRRGIVPMNLASVSDPDTWVLQQSCMFVGEHNQDSAQLTFPKSQSMLISELKLLPCSVSCVLSALPFPFSRVLNLPTLPLVYLIKLTF